MDDKELIDYCEIHCKTDRALFHSGHVNKMLELAKHPDYIKRVPVYQEWLSLHEEDMMPLVELARKNLNKPKLMIMK